VATLLLEITGPKMLVFMNSQWELTDPRLRDVTLSFMYLKMAHGKYRTTTLPLCLRHTFRDHSTFEEDEAVVGCMDKNEVTSKEKEEIIFVEDE